MYNLGYDIGSSTVKIALVDAKTNHEIDVLTHPKEEMPIYAAQSGWAEQDPELWWTHLCEGTKKILFENKIQSKEILAIGISYQMHGLVLVNQAKKAIRKSIIWCDSRAVEIGNDAAQEIGEKSMVLIY